MVQWAKENILIAGVIGTVTVAIIVVMLDMVAPAEGPTTGAVDPESSVPSHGSASADGHPTTQTGGHPTVNSSDIHSTANGLPANSSNPFLPRGNIGIGATHSTPPTQTGGTFIGGNFQQNSPGVVSSLRSTQREGANTKSNTSNFNENSSQVIRVSSNRQGNTDSGNSDSPFNSVSNDEGGNDSASDNDDTSGNGDTADQPEKEAENTPYQPPEERATDPVISNPEPNVETRMVCHPDGHLATPCYCVTQTYINNHLQHGATVIDDRCQR